VSQILPCCFHIAGWFLQEFIRFLIAPGLKARTNPFALLLSDIVA
jgi:hypothetical protein